MLHHCQTLVGERRYSRLGLYLRALCAICGVPQRKVATIAQVAPSTLSDAKHFDPSKKGRMQRPEPETIKKLQEAFQRILEERIARDEREMESFRLPRGWYHGLYYHAPANQPVLDILLFQLDELARKVDPTYQSVIAHQLDELSVEDLEEAEAMYQEGLLYIQQLRRRHSRHNP